MSVSGLILWLKNPEWGLISAAIGITAAGLLAVFPHEIARLIVGIGGFVVVTSIIAANRYYGELGVACLQTDPVSSAKAQYYNKYKVPDGYAEFNVYLDIPDWRDQFAVRISGNGPFEFGAWELPDPVSYKDGLLHCGDDMDEVPFTLRFGGDPDDIGEASYHVHFIDDDSQKEIFSMTLDGSPQFNADHSQEDIDPNVAESLDMHSPSQEA